MLDFTPVTRALNPSRTFGLTIADPDGRSRQDERDVVADHFKHTSADPQYVRLARSRDAQVAWLRLHEHRRVTREDRDLAAWVEGLFSATHDNAVDVVGRVLYVAGGHDLESQSHHVTT
jgi:hypothetical protein